MSILIIVIVGVGILAGIMVYVSSKSPSIIGGWYDKIMGKRVAPQTVIPTENGEMRFEAENDKMGYVQAYDIKTGKLVWEKQIYRVDYDPKLETDVQDVFITKLYIENGKLIVINEHNERFMLDPKTGDIVK